MAVVALGWDAALPSRAGLVQTAGADEAILRHLAPGAKAEVGRALGARPLPPTVPTPDLGALPDFAGGTGWLNGDSLGLPGGAARSPRRHSAGRWSS